MKANHEMCNELFTSMPIDVKRWLVVIMLELQSAEKKNPNWPKDFIHAAAIVNEEAGELIASALQYLYEKKQFHNMHSEAVQVSAMGLRFLINMPKRKLPGEMPDLEPKFQLGTKPDLK